MLELKRPSNMAVINLRDGKPKLGNWDHPYITSAKELGGWAQKNDMFADFQYYIIIC